MDSLVNIHQKASSMLTKTSHFVLTCTLLIFLFSTAAQCGDDNILSPDEHRWLTENKSRIVLAVETGYPPFVFLDSKGTPSGLAHDYLLQLESKLGVNFSRKQLSTLDEIFSKVHNGDVQIVNAVTNTPARSEFLSFTEPFISVPNVIVVRKERSGDMLEQDLAGLKVSLVKSYAITEHLSKSGIGLAAEIVPNDLTAILNVSFGQSDAAVIDLATASYLISQKGITNLRVAGEASRSVQLSMAVPRSETMLLQILQKSLNSITEAERHKIQDKWIHSTEKDIFSDWRFWSVIGGALCVICLLIIGSLIWNKMLRRQVALQTGELANEQEALRESEAYNRMLFDQSPIGLALSRMDGSLVDVNQAYADIIGRTIDETFNLTYWDVTPEKYSLQEQEQLTALNTAGEYGPYEKEYIHKDGHLVPVRLQGLLIERKGEKYIWSSVEDITERKLAQESLWNEKAFLRSLIDSAADLIYFKDSNSVYLGCNKASEKFTGLSEKDQIGKTDFDFFDKEVAEQTVRHDKDVLTGAVAVRLKETVTTASGKKLLFDTVKTPIIGQDGLPIGLVGISRDITEQNKAEQQLQQAQKMESIGSLAGGVAHDFNNLLTVILGHAQLGLMHLDSNHPVCNDLTIIMKTAERSADLTRQLLAFARKQAISPKSMDLNEVIDGMLKMLRRLIGEDIYLAWLPAPDLWQIKADPSQIDQILANLCVNARDAIRGNGRITIETRNNTVDSNYCEGNPEAVPGEYVHLSVSDDGSGMDRETMSHVFEPFFTTKGIGEGTGLGLATVYGIVKQNNGFINIYSEPGKGSTFTIHLPRQAEKSPRTLNEAPAAPLPKGQETILLVEDEPAILQITSLLLRRQGYTVLNAGTPGEAMRLAHGHEGAINLLVTDVVMPEMNGKDLATVLQSQYPQLKCLFMSGYTADVIAQHGVLDEGVHFIQKPFSLPSLAEKVREVIGR